MAVLFQMLFFEIKLKKFSKETFSAKFSVWIIYDPVNDAEKMNSSVQDFILILIKRIRQCSQRENAVGLFFKQTW